MKSIKTAAVSVIVFLHLFLTLRGAVYVDDFNTAHDYLADGVGGTVWEGLLYNFTNGNAVVTKVDADQTASGCLTFQSTHGSWENTDADGLLLYRMVSGDFEATVHVVSMNTVQYHDGGIMARVADSDDAGSGEDWVAVRHFANSRWNGLRSTNNGWGTELNAVGLQPWLRLERIGNVFTAYRSNDGKDWELIASVTRDDMQGLPLQVGLWHATFSANQGTVEFENFTLRQPEIWSGGNSGSWGEALNWSGGLLPDLSSGWAVFNEGAACATTLDGQRKLGRLILSGPANSIGPGSDYPDSQLVMVNSPNNVFSSPYIDVRSGIHTFAAPLILSNDVSVVVADSASLVANGSIGGGGGLVKKGAGMLALGSVNDYAGTTKIESGAIKLSAPPAGTKAWYRFDDANNLGFDNSGLGNHISAFGAPEYVADGVHGGAAYLDGSSYFGRTVFPAGVPVGNSPYTIALWARDDGGPSNGGFCGWGLKVSNQCNNFRYGGSGVLVNYWWANDLSVTGITPNPKDGNWHHLAVTWNGSEQSVYVDGAQVAISARSGLNSQPVDFVVGKTIGDAMLKGWLDEVLIADRALEAGEIAALMNMSQVKDQIPAAAGLEIESGASLYMNGVDQSLASLAGSGIIFNSSPQRVSLSVSNDTACAFDGSFSGLIDLVKKGAGTLQFGGTALNSHVCVESGTLRLNRSALANLLLQSKAWFDAADAASITTNEHGVVTDWGNKGSVGAALDAVLIDETAAPVVEQDGLNKLPVLKLDNTKGLMTVNNTGISGGQDRTLFVVGCRSNSSQNMFYAHIGEGSTSRAFGLASRPDLFFGYVWGSENDVMLAARPNAQCELYDFMLASKFGTVNVMNGSTVGGGVREMSVNTTDTPLYLGSRFAELCSGKLAEVILFDRALSEAERAMVQAYLLAKWFVADCPFSLYGGAYSVAEGAVMDLDGTAQTLSGLSGSGVVTNGTLRVAGEVAPGGVDEIGTLTLATTTSLLGGALVIDVEPDGSSDLLKVQGNLDLAGADLIIADPAKLIYGNRYEIINCTDGALDGVLVPQFTNSAKWRVAHDRVGGKVVLINGGTVIMVR